MQTRSARSSMCNKGGAGPAPALETYQTRTGVTKMRRMHSEQNVLQTANFAAQPATRQPVNSELSERICYFFMIYSKSLTKF